MNNNFVTNTYLNGNFVYDGIFSPEECNTIINSKSVTETGYATIEDEHGNFVIDTTFRNTRGRDIIRTEETDWIGERLLQVVNDANKLYRFHIGYMSRLHILEYDTGGFYNWHIDVTGDEKYCTRKISIVVFLSKREDYVGGQLTFNIGNDKKVRLMPQHQGSVAVFPSFLPHRVEPVTSGKRITMVAWVHGNSFS